MKKLICAVLLAVSLETHAAIYPISAGASVSTIQSMVDAAAADIGPNTVTFAAGSYPIDSQITIPCPRSPLTIQGPIPHGLRTALPVLPLAILTSTLTGNWAFSGTACNVGTTVQFLQFNGGEPSGGGGGFLYVPAGMNNLTVTYNWFYGNQALADNMPVPDPDSFIWLDGSPTTARTQNTTITWNRFGTTGSGDCSAVMGLFGGTVPTQHNYQGGSSYNATGGGCAAVGVHVNTDNFTFNNNSIATQEQGMKFYEGGQSDPNIYTPTNIQINNNDFSGIHRIGIEAQMGYPGPFNVTNNDFHDPILPGYGQWAWSIPQGGPNNCTNNVVLANVATGNDVNGQPGYYSGYGIEFWGVGGSCSNNLIQGLWAGGISWGYGGSPWSVNNNTIQLTTTTNYIDNEEHQTNPPSQSGNVTGQTVSALTSVGPKISPAGGTQSLPLIVTLTDPGSTSGAQPLGNTGIWYTTDGTTPVPGSGSTQYVASGGTFVLPSAATVKAIGMWGALNQPTRYPPGYGFVPSPVISAVFKGPSGPTLVSAYLVPDGGAKTIQLGRTLQFIAHGMYSDGTSAVLPDSTGNVVTAWNTTDHAVTKISTLGHVTAMGVGTATIEGFIGNLQATPSEVTVTPNVASKVLVSAYLASRGGAKSISLGSTLQFIAYGLFSDGSVEALPDSMGNQVTAWNTSNHAIAKVSTLGHVTAMGVGTVTIQSFIGSLQATPAKMAVTPIVAATLQPSVADSESPVGIESPRNSASATLGSPTADKFLGPLWQVVAPNGGFASINDGHLVISVPGGRNHDTLGTSNEAARVVQPISNTDFDVSIKLDSNIEAKDAGTSQGLIALSDNDDFISLALTSDGTNIGLVARIVIDGNATTVLEDATFSQYQSPICLRLTRSGAAYIAWYSFDGVRWTQATSFTYTGTLALIGPFVSNYNNIPENAVPATVSVDWFNVG